MVLEGLTIPEDELAFVTSRSGGPGGQNVNKVSSRVILRFDVAGSPSLTDEQRTLIASRLSTRITKEGVLWLVAQRSRSQIDNRKEAVARFVELLRRALRREKPRRKSVVPDTERRRRLAEKRRRGQVKRRRSAHPPAGDEEE
jgi:ribosome-associated protein